MLIIYIQAESIELQRIQVQVKKNIFYHKIRIPNIPKKGGNEGELTL